MVEADAAVRTFFGIVAFATAVVCLVYAIYNLIALRRWERQWELDRIARALDRMEDDDA